MPNIDSVVVETESVSVVVMAYNRERLTDEDWESCFFSHLRKMRASTPIDRMATLCLGDGPGPNSKQRATGNAIFGTDGRYRFRAAIVTDSVIARGAVTALSWFNPLINAYAPREWRLAFDHVLFTPKNDAAALTVLRTLRSRVPNSGPLNVVVDLLTQATGGRSTAVA